MSWEKLTTKEREELRIYDRTENKLTIGRAQVFRLLALRGDPIGVAHENNAKLQGLLKNRNDSVLAHGARPVQANDYENLFNEANKLCYQLDRNANRLRSRLQFPWLVEKRKKA